MTALYSLQAKIATLNLPVLTYDNILYHMLDKELKMPCRWRRRRTRDMKNYDFSIHRAHPMNITVSIPDELSVFIKTKIASGRYSSTSEVMREALRLLEQADQRHAAELDRLRAAYDAGLASGIAGPFDIERIVAKARERLGSAT
jgi:antitoxin ParD1/3/4